MSLLYQTAAHHTDSKV